MELPCVPHVLISHRHGHHVRPVHVFRHAKGSRLTSTLKRLTSSCSGRLEIKCQGNWVSAPPLNCGVRRQSGGEGHAKFGVTDLYAFSAQRVCTGLPDGNDGRRFGHVASAAFDVALDGPCRGVPCGRVLGGWACRTTVCGSSNLKEW